MFPFKFSGNFSYKIWIKKWYKNAFTEHITWSSSLKHLLEMPVESATVFIFSLGAKALNSFTYVVQQDHCKNSFLLISISFVSVFVYVFQKRNYLDDSHFNINPLKNSDLRIRVAEMSLVLINGRVDNGLLIIK